jgi:hypothetical protein
VSSRFRERRPAASNTTEVGRQEGRAITQNDAIDIRFRK